MATSDDLAELSTAAADDRPRSARPQLSLHKGDVVDRYVVVDHLGAGGMGMVFVAYDPDLDRKVALKVVHPGSGSTSARARLLREAQALARLAHPNIVAIHDVGTIGEDVWLAMEFIEGRTLGAWVQEEPRSWRDVVAVMRPVALALAAAHGANLIHRDIKPGNILVGHDGRVRVLDFGLARETAATTGDQELAASEASASPPDGRLQQAVTQHGAVVGTPGYMAPEQLRGQTTDARSDVFSFCVTCWEVLFGQRPFGGDEVLEVISNTLNGSVRPISDKSKVPGWLETTIRRGLAPEPEQRWQSMDELHAALSPEATRRRWPWAAGGLVVAATVVAFATHERADPCAEFGEAAAEAWNENTQNEVETAIIGTGAPFAREVWSRVGPDLDTWASAWTEESVGACEATRVRATQSEEEMYVRMACLQRAEQRFSATVDVLAGASLDTVVNADTLVASLPELGECEAGGDLAQVPPPPVELIDAVARVRELVAKAEARRNAGDYAGALDAGREAEVAATELDFEPVRSEALLQLGLAHGALGNHADAERRLRESLEAAARSNHRDIMHGSAIALMHSLGAKQNHEAAALAISDVARGLSDSLDKKAGYRNNLATVFNAAGRYAEAEVEFRAAIDLWVEANGPEEPNVPIAKVGLASVLQAQGKYSEAESVARSALLLQQASLGDGHPNVAMSRNNLGSILQISGQHAAAESEFRRALDAAIAALGADHELTATTRLNFATLLDAEGRYTEAESEARAAVQVFEDAPVRNAANVGAARHALAQILTNQGRHVEAEAEHRAALDALLEDLGADHPLVAIARVEIAESLRTRGAFAEAVEEFEVAIPFIARAYGADHPFFAISKANLANALAALGRFDEAHAEYRIAEQVFSEGGARAQLAEMQGARAEALALEGRFEEAEAGYRESIRGLEAALGDEHVRLAQPLTSLANVLVQHQRFEEALPLLRRVEEILGEGASDPTREAKRKFVLARALWGIGGIKNQESAYQLATQAMDVLKTSEKREAIPLEKIETWIAEHGVTSH